MVAPMLNAGDLDRRLLTLGFVSLLGCCLPAQTQDDAKGIAFFEAKIRPVLADRCYSCHSLKAEKIKGERAYASKGTPS